MNYKEWVIKISERISNEEFVSRLAIERPDIEPLEEYQGIDTKIKCRCKKCGDIFYTTPWILLHGKGGNGCRKCNGTKKKTHEEYLAELKDKNSTVVPIEEYQGNAKNIMHKCLICGYEWSVRPANILSGCGCTACSHKAVWVGHNDLATTNPEIIGWLKDPEDAKRYTATSHKKVDWICPLCGAEVNQKEINDVVRYGHVPCKQCSDGVSYPMKFVVNMFKQLEVPITTENKYDWCRFEMHGKIRGGMYDITFQKDGKNYIVEVDGGFHFRDSGLNGQSKEESQYIDKEKQRLAEENGYHVIRVMAVESTKDYMRNALFNSELASMYDLSTVDWNECNTAALSSLVVECANLWNEYHSANQVSKIIGHRQEVVVRYLNKAREAGLCDYDGHIEHIKSGQRNISLAHAAIAAKRAS